MDDIKSKFLGLLNKQSNKMKVPAMGFSEYFIQNVSQIPESTKKIESPHEQTTDELVAGKLSDQELLESTDGIYFEEDVNTDVYILNKFSGDTVLNDDQIMKIMLNLKEQQKVISKKVLQLILEQRNVCNEEFNKICETEKCLEESLWICKKGRSYLNFAKKNLTTTSLEILATYKKREILMDLIKTLNMIKKMKTTEYHIQQLLSEDNYSGAITILLEFKSTALRNTQYKCVEELSQKLQDILLLTEVQMDEILNEMTLSFSIKKYSKLQEAYKLLNKTLIAMDQLHMNFISTIHTTALNVVRSYLSTITDEKLLFDEICENIPAERYITCLISLCKSFWTILVCYYQVTIWHQNTNLFDNEKNSHGNNIAPNDEDHLIKEKLKKGQIRIWNDIQSKICVYLSSFKLNQLKFEQFIQVLLIVQRLEKVGKEFCNEISHKLIETMKSKSVEFFKRYHTQCLDEISLFLDNEIWVSVNSFTSIQQLQEFRSVKKALQRHSVKQTEANVENNSLHPKRSSPPLAKNKNNYDAESSIHSQDGSSIYAFNGYFFRFNEKSSPFDGGFDESMLEEDILSGIADEASCYFSEESDNDLESQNNNNKVPTTSNSSEQNETNNNYELIVSNTSLTVLRCIGRYLQMCRLLHSISFEIFQSMTELIDFYVFAVHDIFATDVPFSSNENLYSAKLNHNLDRISKQLLPKLNAWHCDTMIVKFDLQDAEQLYGLAKRIVGVESCVCLIKQFQQLEGYINYLLSNTNDKLFSRYYAEVSEYIVDLRKPVYISATSRVFDIPNILLQMSKVKWEINHVTVQHSAYIDNINRNIQVFAMRLEEIAQVLTIPKESVWDTVAHVLTHVLVEGYSNAKKCSTGGRALMQLDFTHLLSILELISGHKYSIHQNYVEIYVKAYYFPKDLLEEWIKEQSEKNSYSLKHLIGLIACTCCNDKKMKQKLLSIIQVNGENPTP